MAEPADSEGLADLHYLSHTVAFAEFASPEWLQSRDLSEYVKQWQEFFRAAETDATARAWKAFDGKAIVGMVKVSPMSDNETQLTSMHVHPDYQRRGIGSMLMRETIAFMRASGFERAMLGVIQANRAARAMYERAGWTVRELRPTGVEGVPIAVYELQI